MTELGQQQKLTQEQQMSARQLQSLELLHLPLIELSEKIDEIMADNPVLEYTELPGTAISTVLPAGESENDGESGSGDETFDLYNSSENDNWLENLPIPDGNFESYSPDAARSRDNFFANAAEVETMQEQLLKELSFLDFQPIEQEIANMIVGSLDDDGFLTSNIADIAMACNADMPEVKKVLRQIQKVAPPGVCASNLSNSLHLQLKIRGEKDERLYELVDNYLDEIAKNHLQNVAAKLGIEISELKILLEKIKTLNPHPGRVMDNRENSYIFPEVEIIRNEDGSYSLLNNDVYVPKIGISDYYLKLLDDPKLTDEDRNYLKKKFADAGNFRNSLLLREKTIVRIAEVIMETQKDFLDSGVDALKPMTMAQVAEKLSLHETTVSRGCANKYIKTPQGVFEFKFFFSGGFTNAEGEDISSRSIKEKIRQLIEDEDAAHPLSDDKISEMLKTSGLQVARRTVAKYRDAMGLLPTNLRRRHC